MAAANQAAGKKGPIVWQQPKLQHQREFMLRFMQTSIPLVVMCMRARYPMREVPKPGGGKDWRRSEQLDPKQADDILFEMFVHGWIGREDHGFHLTKCTAKALEPVFRDGQPITLETGRALADWARGGPQKAGPPTTNDTVAVTPEAATAWLGKMKQRFAEIDEIDTLESLMQRNNGNLASMRADYPDVANSCVIAYDDRLKELSP